MIEESYLVEPPEATCMRHNTDVIYHLAVAYSSATDKKHCDKLLDLIKAHSEFLLQTSGQTLKRQKFYIERVK